MRAFALVFLAISRGQGSGQLHIFPNYTENAFEHFKTLALKVVFTVDETVIILLGNLINFVFYYKSPRFCLNRVKLMEYKLVCHISKNFREGYLALICKIQ